ncbi:hemolysin III family protein [Rheinheimera sp. D18]|uniref:PAQR family membrane homeostasis protein TrhA n=1 Tax=Rheinheimera sp. D18 TaxID=2545632 RepID=UPI001051F206|nr:hemolysin III family protein [Rheinheimera sp. D18]QBL09134.1 hemolysin III family protein [Rheinheimera sp. D18]
MSTTFYTPFEERLHALSHGIGAILSVFAVISMLRLSALHNDSWHYASSIIYGVSLVLLYSSSTLYHSIANIEIKRKLRQLDHAAIFILIAGTYTPFTLINLRADWGIALFALIWSVALVGVILELATKLKYKKLSLSLYLGMGWLVVLAIKPMLDNVEIGGLLLLLAGGLSYSVGVIFYAWKKLYLHHVIWHLFVLAGSILHFFAVYFYVLA